MEIRLKNLQRHVDGPGDHLVAQVQQVGAGKSESDSTVVIVETSPDGGDVRIVDGETVVKVQLDPGFSIASVLQDDVFLSGE